MITPDMHAVLRQIDEHVKYLEVDIEAVSNMSGTEPNVIMEMKHHLGILRRKFHQLCGDIK